jgi:hypothetical protein
MHRGSVNDTIRTFLGIIAGLLIAFAILVMLYLSRAGAAP